MPRNAAAGGLLGVERLVPLDGGVDGVDPVERCQELCPGGARRQPRAPVDDADPERRHAEDLAPRAVRTLDRPERDVDLAARQPLDVQDPAQQSGGEATLGGVGVGRDLHGIRPLVLRIGDPDRRDVEDRVGDGGRPRREIGIARDDRDAGDRLAVDARGCRSGRAPPSIARPARTMVEATNRGLCVRSRYSRRAMMPAFGRIGSRPAIRRPVPATALPATLLARASDRRPPGVRLAR